MSYKCCFNILMIIKCFKNNVYQILVRMANVCLISKKPLFFNYSTCVQQIFIQVDLIKVGKIFFYVFKNSTKKEIISIFINKTF